MGDLQQRGHKGSPVGYDRDKRLTAQGGEMSIYLRYGWNDTGKEVKTNYRVFGNNAYVSFGSVVITGNAAELADRLAEIAQAIRPKSVSQVAQQRRELPPELATPETGWPWLIANFPQWFDGINLNKEPYAHYLRSAAAQVKIIEVERKCARCGELLRNVTRKYCNDACKQAAYRDRKAA